MYLTKKPICIFKYLDEGDYTQENVLIKAYDEIIKSINSKQFLKIRSRKYLSGKESMVLYGKRASLL